MTIALDSILTKSEADELKDNEQYIERWVDDWPKVAEKLKAIRDKKLYRTQFASFPEYVESRWKRTKRWANQIIQSAEAIKSLPGKVGRTLPTLNASTAIAHVPKEARSKVVEAAEKSGSVTAASVEKAAETSKPKVIDLDDSGRVIPEAIQPAWCRAKEKAGQWLRELSAMKCAIEEGLEKDTRDVIYAEVGNALIAHLKNAYAEVKNVDPSRICPTCHGKVNVKGCQTCGKRGFISEFYWKNKIDSKTKAAIEGSVKQ